MYRPAAQRAVSSRAARWGDESKAAGFSFAGGFADFENTNNRPCKQCAQRRLVGRLCWIDLAENWVANRVAVPPRKFCERFQGCGPSTDVRLTPLATRMCDRVRARRDPVEVVRATPGGQNSSRAGKRNHPRKLREYRKI